MMVTEYGEAAVEVLDILNNTNQDDVKKIPQSFIDFLVNIASKNYRANLNHNKTIDELDIKKQTKELLGFIYITWWCNGKEQENYKESIKEIKNKEEDVKRQKYNPEDVFKNKQEKNINSETEEKNLLKNNQANLVVYENENIVKKIIKKIIEFFNNIKKNK